MQKEIVIKCPYCGWEYLPSEIYMPNSFLGKAYQIYRKEDGTIDVYDGHNMDLSEEFVCDHCNKPFTIEADVKFKTETKKQKDFSVPYSTKLD